MKLWHCVMYFAVGARRGGGYAVIIVQVFVVDILDLNTVHNVMRHS